MTQQVSRFPRLARAAKAFANRLATLHPSKEAAALASIRVRFDLRQWNAELLKQLEWRRFEELCAAYYQALGFHTAIEGIGADGGVDIVLKLPPAERVHSVARCKAWDAYRVGVKSVKEGPRDPRV